MRRKLAIAHHKRFLQRWFAPPDISSRVIRRTILFFNNIRKYDLLKHGVDIVEPNPVEEKLLELVHDPRYIEFVKRRSEEGHGYLDIGDTPAYPGVFEDACLAVGATMTLVDLVMKGEYEHGFNPVGGFHHARRAEAAGFGVFNDVALVARYLRERYGVRRVAIVDIDGHHGEGTQQILYDEDVLKISIHRYDPFFFPGTGDIHEIGEGRGHGFSVNVPLPQGAGDRSFIYAFEEVVVPLLEEYRPEVLIVEFGVDGHYRDPMVGLRLTSESYEHAARRLNELAHKLADGRMILLAGGGYDPEAAARMWTLMAMHVSETVMPRAAELRDPTKPKERDGVFENVKRIVDELRRLIFPLHGLEP